MRQTTQRVLARANGNHDDDDSWRLRLQVREGAAELQARNEGPQVQDSSLRYGRW